MKDQATGLPSSLGGVVEFFGSSQQVPAKQYRHLKLTGLGTKTTTGGSFTVTDTIFIANAVTLRVEAGCVVTSNGMLREQGYFAGKMKKTVDLSGSTSSSDFGNIGISISWSGTAPEPTTVTRGSDISLTGNGNESIKRYYDIVPATNSGLNATLVFKYSDNELNGQNPATLSLWRSNDGGATWRKQGGTVDVNARTITKMGVTTFSLWTAADNDHPLGPPSVEGVATDIALTAGNNASGPISSAVSPSVVTVTDALGNPVPGVSVTFAIASVPAGAAGQSLSVTNALTGANGQASTVLTLGNKAGTYSVTATSTGLAGSPVTFSATATVTAAAAMALTSGNNQTGIITTVLPIPLLVTVTDAGGNPVQGVLVIFSIASAPSGATGQSLSEAKVTTDSIGHASTVLTLGNKVGAYSVTATSAGLTGSPVTFDAIAIHGAATALYKVAGDSQSTVVNRTLTTPFTVKVTDVGDNPVPGASIVFSIDSIPLGATGQSLSTTSVLTDTNGLGTALLTAGNKVGTYRVKANVTGSSVNPVLFTVTVKGTPPQFVGAKDSLFAYRGVPFEYQLRVSVSEGSVLQFLKVSGPSWLRLDSTSGALSGTPGPNDLGLWALVVEVTDNFGQSVIDTFYVRVNAGVPTEFQLL
ncbi:MAG: putative Ig domain-containing protein, partial [Bacteroidota bacterium]